MNHRHEAALKQCMRMAQSEDGVLSKDSRVSAEEIRAAREYFGDDVAWAMGAVPSNAAPASMLAAIAFAHQVDAPSIEEFADIYVRSRLSLGGPAHSKNEPAVTLARWMNTSGKHGRAGGEYTKEVIFKTLAACRSHLDGKSMERIIGAKASEGGAISRSTTLAWFNRKRAEHGKYALEFE